MFSFKKIALLGAAGLAAFSMSCSDDGNEEEAINPGGTITDISVSGGYIIGTVTANSGNTVKSVTVTAANGRADGGTSVSGTPASVNLASLGWELTPGICTGSTVSEISVTITVKAEFASDGPAEESAAVKVNCTLGFTLPPNLDKSGNVELGAGSAGSKGSFLEIDGSSFAVITIGNATTKANDIDLIYDGTNFKTPEGCKAGATGSFCKTQMTSSTSEASLWDITDAKPLAANKSAKELVAMWCNTDPDAGNVLPDGENVISNIKLGGLYFVYTSDGNLAVVSVSEITNTEIKLLVGRSDMECSAALAP